MTAPRRSYYKSYRSTFFIFPALIPLVEILPWLLGLIGGVAGAVEFLRIRVWHRPRVRILSIVAVLCVLTPIGITTWHFLSIPSKAEGSVPVTVANFSKVEVFNPVPQEAKVPQVFSHLWDQALSAQILGTPVVADGKLIFGTNSKTIEARNLSDGQKFWGMSKQEPVFTSAAIAGDIGVIGEGVHTAPSATLTAFKVKTGEILWERKFRSHLESEPVIEGDQLWFGAGAEGLWSLDLSDGNVIWRNPIGHIDVKPLLLDGRLFVAAKLAEDDAISGSAMFELNKKNGKILWQKEIPGNPMGDLLRGPDGQILLSTAIGQVGLNRPTDKGWLHSFTPEGELRWTIELPAMSLPEGSVVADAHLIILALKNGALMAVDTDTGKTVWMAGTGKEFLADALVIPASDKNPALVVAVSSEGQVTIRQARDGKEVMHFKIGAGSYAAPVYFNDILYICEPYKLSAYGPVSALGLAP